MHRLFDLLEVSGGLARDRSEALRAERRLAVVRRRSGRGERGGSGGEWRGGREHDGRHHRRRGVRIGWRIGLDGGSDSGSDIDSDSGRPMAAAVPRWSFGSWSWSAVDGGGSGGGRGAAGGSVTNYSLSVVEGALQSSQPGGGIY